MITNQKAANKKSTLKLYAAPLVMLVLASALATPTASAEVRQGSRIVQAEFRYNADAPAEQIYARLRDLADRMCVTKGPRPLALRKADEACIASAMADGISRIGRTDIAALHGRTAG